MVTAIVEQYCHRAEETETAIQTKVAQRIEDEKIPFAQDKPTFYGVAEDVGVGEGEGWPRAAAAREASARAAAARAALAGIGPGGIVGRECSLDSAYLRRIDAS